MFRKEDSIRTSKLHDFLKKKKASTGNPFIFYDIHYQKDNMPFFLVPYFFMESLSLNFLCDKLQIIQIPLMHDLKSQARKQFEKNGLPTSTSLLSHGWTCHSLQNSQCKSHCFEWWHFPLEILFKKHKSIVWKG